MDLPNSYPSTMRALAQNGYVARSGNQARIELAAENGGRTGYVVIWSLEPSENDKHEFEDIIQSGGGQIQRGPDLTSERAVAACANQMKKFLKD